MDFGKLLPFRIACIGDSCVDRYEALGKTFPGGNPVNYAVYFRRLGAEASFIGAVGGDREGMLVCRALKKKGIDLSHVQTLPGRTSSIEVRMVDGNRVFGTYDAGVMEDYKLREEDYAFLEQHALAISAMWGRCENDLPRIRETGIPVAFDCADLPFEPAAQTALPHTDVAFFSDDTADEAALKQTMQTLYAMGPSIVVAMRGASGSLAYDGEAYYAQKAIECPVVDTLGAGDSYIAGFLLGWLNRLPIPECMEAGAENAAITIGYVGAW